VLVLRYYDDLTEAAAAEVLGCSIGTVKNSSAKALRSLRQAPGLIDVLSEARS
jgi:DNA-directed RNA polymerase specialized sigma24 family protein